MMRQVVLLLVLCGATVVAAAAEKSPADADREFEQRVARLVRQLDDDSAARRDAAAAELAELAGTTAESVDRLLALLPAESDEMPLAVRDRLARLRQSIEDRAAKAVLAGSTVTLKAEQMPIWDALTAVEQATGNRVVDHRRRGGDLAGQNGVTIDLNDEPFWSAMDALLDQANLSVYPYAGEDALAIVERNAGDAPRRGSAVYSGPFRVEALEIQAQRSLRQPNRDSLKLQLEVAWEPRLRPIAVSQAAGDIVAIDEAGEPLQPRDTEAVYNAEIPTGTQATELVLPFALPPRSVTKIASLKGKLRALVPGRQVKFEFGDLANAAGQSQRQGGVEVVVDAVRKNNEIWEIHMRLRLKEDNQALQSHRGWAFQNLSYLVDSQGESIDNAGLETTLQRPNEVGVAYFFDLPAGVDGLTWVYETPAAIVEMPVEYELENLALP